MLPALVFWFWLQPAQKLKRPKLKLPFCSSQPLTADVFACEVAFEFKVKKAPFFKLCLVTRTYSSSYWSVKKKLSVLWLCLLPVLFVWSPRKPHKAVKDSSRLKFTSTAWRQQRPNSPWCLCLSEEDK